MALSVNARQYLTGDVLRNRAPVRAPVPDRIHKFFLEFCFFKRPIVTKFFNFVGQCSDPRCF